MRLVKTTEDSIKWITEQLQQSGSDQITLSSHNIETDEVIFDFVVANDKVYQALGNQCQAWVDEPDPSIIVYAMVRG